MEPEGIQNELGRLPGWMALLGPRVQTLQRTCVHPTYDSALRFTGDVGELAQERELFAHLNVRPNGPGGVPTQVRVRITDPHLAGPHFELAHRIEDLYAASPGAAGVPSLTVLE